MITLNRSTMIYVHIYVCILLPKYNSKFKNYIFAKKEYYLLFFAFYLFHFQYVFIEYLLRKEYLIYFYFYPLRNIRLSDIFFDFELKYERKFILFLKKWLQHSIPIFSHHTLLILFFLYDPTKAYFVIMQTSLNFCHFLPEWMTI